MTTPTALSEAAEPGAVPRRRAGRWLARTLVAAIELYRTAISPLRPPACRYTPSCSAYAAEAIRVHGAGRGLWLALRRLLRCHPFHAGGHDPVPSPVARRGSRSFE